MLLLPIVNFQDIVDDAWWQDDSEGDDFDPGDDDDDEEDEEEEELEDGADEGNSNYDIWLLWYPQTVK